MYLEKPKHHNLEWNKSQLSRLEKKMQPASSNESIKAGLCVLVTTILQLIGFLCLKAGNMI